MLEDMTGLGITVLICSLSSPETCMTRELSFSEVPVTPWACMYAQTQIAEMMQGYPERYVKKWTCHALGTNKQDI